VAIVDVRFTALPAHVRTARLVALAVARRVGVSDEQLDEVRLAVGEACSRAVGVHTSRAPAQPVVMRLFDDHDCFTVEVIDVGPLEDDASEAVAGSFGALSSADDLVDDDLADSMPPSFGLAVIGGLVEEVVVTSDAAGTHVKMSWPAASAADAAI
jgi:serine/threonine-protein kinase RsbW